MKRTEREYDEKLESTSFTFWAVSLCNDSNNWDILILKKDLYFADAWCKCKLERKTQDMGILRHVTFRERAPVSAKNQIKNTTGLPVGSFDLGEDFLIATVWGSSRKRWPECRCQDEEEINSHPQRRTSSDVAWDYGKGWWFCCWSLRDPRQMLQKITPRAVIFGNMWNDSPEFLAHHNNHGSS